MPTPTRVTRRALLAAAGASALLVVAGCNPLNSAPKTLTITAQAPPPTAPMEALIAKIRLHVLHLDAAITAMPGKAALLTMLRDDRIAHLNALQVEYDRDNGIASAAPSAPPTGSVTMPDGQDAILGVIRQDAGDAQLTFTDATGTASRYRAMLYGSITACLATHRAVLG